MGQVHGGAEPADPFNGGGNTEGLFPHPGTCAHTLRPHLLIASSSLLGLAAHAPAPPGSTTLQAFRKHKVWGFAEINPQNLAALNGIFRKLDTDNSNTLDRNDINHQSPVWKSAGLKGHPTLCEIGNSMIAGESYEFKSQPPDFVPGTDNYEHKNSLVSLFLKAALEGNLPIAKGTHKSVKEWGQFINEHLNKQIGKLVTDVGQAIGSGASIPSESYRGITFFFKEEHLAKIAEQFDQLDSDGSGSIDKHERPNRKYKIKLGDDISALNCVRIVCRIVWSELDKHLNQKDHRGQKDDRITREEYILAIRNAILEAEVFDVEGTMSFLHLAEGLNNFANNAATNWLDAWQHHLEKLFRGERSTFNPLKRKSGGGGGGCGGSDGTTFGDFKAMSRWGTINVLPNTAGDLRRLFRCLDYDNSGTIGPEDFVGNGDLQQVSEATPCSSSLQCV
jgi:Ca2+-binding EF-hand superfamily protein